MTMLPNISITSDDIEHIRVELERKLRDKVTEVLKDSVYLAFRGGVHSPVTGPGRQMIESMIDDRITDPEFEAFVKDKFNQAFENVVNAAVADFIDHNVRAVLFSMPTNTIRQLLGERIADYTRKRC